MLVSYIYIYSLLHSAMIIEHIFTIINSVFLSISFNLWFGCSDGQSIVPNSYVHPHYTLEPWCGISKNVALRKAQTQTSLRSSFHAYQPKYYRPAAHQSLNIQATCKGSHQTTRMHRLVSVLAVVHTSLSKTPYRGSSIIFKMQQCI